MNQYRESIKLLIRNVRNLGATPVFLTQAASFWYNTPGSIVDSPKTVLTANGTTFNGFETYHLYSESVKTIKSTAEAGRCLSL